MTVELAVAARDQTNAEAKALEQREREGRDELHRQIANADTVLRAAALKEIEGAGRRRSSLQEKIEKAEAAVQRLRAEFLNRRMARQQVESLVERDTARLREKELRRAQQSLDDWFNRKDADAKRADEWKERADQG